MKQITPKGMPGLKRHGMKKENWCFVYIASAWIVVYYWGNESRLEPSLMFSGKVCAKAAKIQNVFGLRIPSNQFILDPGYTLLLIRKWSGDMKML